MVDILGFLSSVHSDAHHAFSIWQNNFWRRLNVHETPTSTVFTDQIKRNSSGCFRKDININNDYIVLIHVTTYSFKNSFLPTMPEDSFGETAAAISEGGNWYRKYYGIPW